MKQVNRVKSWRVILSTLTLALVAISTASISTAAQAQSKVLPNVILVHGAWADGSSWSAVIERLQANGYNVMAPQFPLTSLEANVAKLQQVLARVTGPTILVGHSYGGQIITAGGALSDKVVGLVYIAAFGLDEGESIGELLAHGEPTAALAHLTFDEMGFGWLPQEDFVKHFASDVNPVWANAMWAVQQPIHASALADVMGTPAWKSLPSWYMVATNDEAIPPDAERLFAKRMGATVVEVESSHVPLASQPDAVVMLIEQAVQAVSSK